MECSAHLAPTLERIESMKKQRQAQLALAPNAQSNQRLDVSGCRIHAGFVRAEEDADTITEAVGTHCAQRSDDVDEPTPCRVLSRLKDS
jgi:hypothetical protein